LEALKIAPPISALAIYAAATCWMSSRKPLPESPKLPSVNTRSRANSKMPMV